MEIRKQDLQSEHLKQFDEQIAALNNQKRLNNVTSEGTGDVLGNLRIQRTLTQQICDIKIRKQQLATLS